MAVYTDDVLLEEYVPTDYAFIPVAAAVSIPDGLAVGENGSGYARQLVAADVFLGMNVDGLCDNADGLAGDIIVKIKKRGVVKLDVAGATAITANDRPAVYASDGKTFTLTSAGNSLIGWVVRWLSGTTCVVEYDATMVKAALHV